MKPMNKNVLEEILKRPQQCARRKEPYARCGGRITIEHTMGRRRERAWNCIWLCAKHAGIEQWADKKHFNKQINLLHAYLQATDEELESYKLRASYKKEKRFLLLKYKDLIN